MCLTVYSVASFFFLCYWDCESNAVQCCAVLCCARPYNTVQVPDSNGIGVGNGVGDGTGPLMYGTLFLFVTDFFCVLQVLYTLHSPAYSSVVYMG